MDLRQPLKRRRTSLDGFGVATTYDSSSVNTNHNNSNNNNITNQNDENQNPAASAANATQKPQQQQFHLSVDLLQQQQQQFQQQQQQNQFVNNNNINSNFSSRNSSRLPSPVPQSITMNNNNNQQNNNRNIINVTQNNNGSRLSPTPSFISVGDNGSTTSGVCRDVEPDTPTMRVSRHVPNRDEMNVDVSSFNLTGGGEGNLLLSAANENSNGGGMMGDHLDSNSGSFSFSASFNDNNNPMMMMNSGSSFAANNAENSNNSNAQNAQEREHNNSYREQLAEGLTSNISSSFISFSQQQENQNQNQQNNNNNNNATIISSRNNNNNPFGGIPSISPPPPSNNNGTTTFRVGSDVLKFGNTSMNTNNNNNNNMNSSTVSVSSVDYTNNDGNNINNNDNNSVISSHTTTATTTTRGGAMTMNSSQHQHQNHQQPFHHTRLGRSSSRAHSSSNNNNNNTESKRSTATRPFNPNPEKVLDAPDLPEAPCQLLDWGPSNQLVIGLRSTLYCWDASDGSARTVCDIPDDQVITGVSWLRGGTASVMVQNNATLAITDMSSGQLSRLLFPAVDSGAVSKATASLDSSSSTSGGNSNYSFETASNTSINSRIVSSVAVCGPLVAAATTLGTVCLYDVRTPNIVGHFDAHQGGISSLAFCNSEPHYLASGGTTDGSVRLWDYRNTSNARYTFDRIHSTNNNNNNNNNAAVSSLCFFADKRSIVFSGGSDGTLLALNTHGNSEDFVVCQSFSGVAAPITGIVSSPGTGEIATSHGVGAGYVQLRKAHKFPLLATFQGPGTNAAINCLTLAPDGERVCGAQLDETLKFWKVFDRSYSASHYSQQQNSHSHSSAAIQNQIQNNSNSNNNNGDSSSNNNNSRSGIVQPGQRIRQRAADEEEFVDFR